MTEAEEYCPAHYPRVRRIVGLPGTLPVGATVNGYMGRVLAVVAVVTALWGGAVLADDPTPVSTTVVDVRVKGNQRMSDAAVLFHVRTRIGAPYDESVVKADEQRLLETGQFSSVVASKTVTDRGVVVTFTVRERAAIVEVRIVGAKKVPEGELMKALTFGPGHPLDRFAIENGRRAIESVYREKSYTQVEVTLDEDALRDGRVIYTVREGPRTLISRIRFEGNTHFGWLKLRMSIGSAQRFWPFVAGVLDDEQVERDVVTLRNMFVGDGYLDAEVSRRIELSADNTRAVLTFVISQGQRYTVGAIVFHGNTVFSDADLLSRLAMQVGDYFTSLGLRRDVETLQNAYGEVGHLYAVVRASRQFPTPTGPRAEAVVNVIYDITEDQAYHVGRIIIRGNVVTQDRIVRRDLRFFPEQLYDTVAVEESRKRLMETQLFTKVTISPEGTTPGVRDAVVVVEEGNTAQIMLGVGVNTNSGLVGDITYVERNFDILAWPGLRRAPGTPPFKGAGQRLTISVQPGVELSQAYVDWFEPRLGDSRVSLGQRVYFFMRKRETYDEQRGGYMASVGKRFPNRWYVELSGRLEGVRLNSLDSDAPPEVVADKGSTFLAGPKLTFTRDRTDSRWLPSTGDRFQMSYEQIVGGATFGETVLDYRCYRTVWVDALDRKHILAGRLTAGSICGDAPVFERFYGGGIGSMRGFDYRGISPRSKGTDKQIGGDFLFLAGAEYTFPLVGDMLRGVLFLDTGTVEENFEVTTYRAAAGFGVRWVIPLLGQVPMSFDFGFPISKDSQDDTQIFSFSVGWTF
jgi:outer membrane protein insertion porin family